VDIGWDVGHHDVKKPLSAAGREVHAKLDWTVSLEVGLGLQHEDVLVDISSAVHDRDNVNSLFHRALLMI
jgi:hypothetical protein